MSRSAGITHHRRHPPHPRPCRSRLIPRPPNPPTLLTHPPPRLPAAAHRDLEQQHVAALRRPRAHSDRRVQPGGWGRGTRWDHTNEVQVGGACSSMQGSACSCAARRRPRRGLALACCASDSRIVPLPAAPPPLSPPPPPPRASDAECLPRPGRRQSSSSRARPVPMLQPSSPHAGGGRHELSDRRQLRLPRHLQQRRGGCWCCAVLQHAGLCCGALAGAMMPGGLRLGVPCRCALAPMHTSATIPFQGFFHVWLRAGGGRGVCSSGVHQRRA